MKPKTRLWIAGAILLGMCLAAVGVWRAAAGRTTYRRTLTIHRETLPVTVMETGLLEPKEYEIVTSPVHGILVELIPEGRDVHKGDKVARVNDEEAREEYDKQEITIKNRQALLRKAQLDLDLAQKDLEYERRKAKTAIAQAELELDELRKKPAATVLALGGVGQDYWKTADKVVMKLAQLDVEYALIEEEQKLKTYERQKTLSRQGVASDNDVADARLKYEKALATLESARIILELVQKGTPESDIRVAQEKATQARIKLAQIEQSTQAQLDLKKAAVAVAQAEMDRTKESLEINREVVRSTIVTAPVDGTVLYWGQWERPHEGDRVWRGNGFLSITQMGKMVILTRVNEVDSRRVGVGQKAIIRLEAVPGKVYHGKVTRMAGLAIDRDERQQGVLKRELSGVMVFDVTVEIEEETREILPTMSATVEIIVEELRDAIAIPYSALYEGGGKEWVYVLRRGRPVRREVTLGRSVNSRFVVTAGLEEGDVVCLR